MFEIQVKGNGGYVLFEHPYTAKSWKTKLIERLFKLSPITIAKWMVTLFKGDQCMFQQPFLVKGEAGYVRNPTGWATNAPCIGRKLSIQCDGAHHHLKALNGVSKLAECYPIRLCRAVLAGISDQLAVDAVLKKFHSGPASPMKAWVEDKLALKTWTPTKQDVSKARSFLSAGPTGGRRNKAFAASGGWTPHTI